MSDSVIEHCGILYHSFYLMVELLLNCNANMKNLQCVVISFLKNN